MRVLRVGLLVGVGVLASVVGVWIPFSDQWPFFEALRTTSAIVFGLMGAWIAIVYPDTLSNIFAKRLSEADRNLERVQRLRQALALSFGILLLLLAIGPLSLALRAAPFSSTVRLTMRGVAFGALTTLTIVQMWAALLAIAPSVDLENYARRLLSREKMKSRFTRRSSRG
jgi:hypothetical protein